MVDLGGPAYRCTCPSRKVPCKHALGLLLGWAAGTGPTPTGRPTGAANGSSRARRPRPGPRIPPTKRPRPSGRNRRADRVAGGIDELDRGWPTRSGPGWRPWPGRYRHFESVAARMVDAQAPGLAGTLRRLPGVPASARAGRATCWRSWRCACSDRPPQPRPAAAGAGRLRPARGRLPGGQGRRAGRPAVADRWQVLGRRDTDQERISTRRIWLRGTGPAVALVLVFAAGWPAGPWTPGSSRARRCDADLHFYPGAPPLRALVGARPGEPEPAGAPAGGGPGRAAAEWAAVAADPWTSRGRSVLRGVPVPGEPHWQVRDAPARRCRCGRTGPTCGGAGRGLRRAAGRRWRRVRRRGLRPLTVVDGAGWCCCDRRADRARAALTATNAGW